MIMLISGVLLFAGVHFIPSLAPNLKTQLLTRLGESGYKGIFSLLLLASFGLMIAGWRGAQFTYVYQPPISLRSLALGIMVVAFILLAASSLKTRLKQWVRHPQLTGVVLWGAAHLLLNGDSRSIVLFGGLGLWALASIVTINHREGAWEKPPVPPFSSEIILVTAAAITIAITVFAHPWLSGMPVL